MPEWYRRKGSLYEIPLWRDGRECLSLDVETLTDYRGEPLARVHQAPALMAQRVAAALRRAAPGPAEEPAHRLQAIARAGELLTTAALGGCTGAEHARLVTRATGIPVHWTQQGLAELAQGLTQVHEALARQLPGGNLTALGTRRLRLPRTDGEEQAWVPVGRVLAFVAPSNHPAVHLTWVLALAMGWTVAVRPGRLDPFTPRRLLLALQAAGFPGERVALLPGDHDLVPALVEACDRSIAYGGERLAQRLGGHPRVRFHGPGRSKVLVDAPANTARAADFVYQCILHDGGRKCTCASGLLVRGVVPGLVAGIRERLRDLPLLDPLDPAARVPLWRGGEPPAPAQVVNRQNLAFLQPDLVLCPAPGFPGFGQELPSPWATAAELPAGADPLPLLRGSLAVTLLSRDDALAEACLLEPSIAKVYQGPVPTWFSPPGAPHQGSLADFLFTRKAWYKEALP